MFKVIPGSDSPRVPSGVHDTVIKGPGLSSAPCQAQVPPEPILTKPLLPKILNTIGQNRKHFSFLALKGDFPKIIYVKSVFCLLKGHRRFLVLLRF